MCECECVRVRRDISQAGTCSGSSGAKGCCGGIVCLSECENLSVIVMLCSAVCLFACVRACARARARERENVCENARVFIYMQHIPQLITHDYLLISATVASFQYSFICSIIKWHYYLRISGTVASFQYTFICSIIT